MNPARSLLKSLFSTVINNPILSRPLSTSIPCRGEKSTGESDTRLSRIGKNYVELGTSGAESWINVRLKELDRLMPTPETMDQLFDGVPYKKLPLIFIRAGKNNTIITAYDYTGLHLMGTNSKKEGFLHAKKKTSIAAQTTGFAAGQRLLRRGIKQARVVVKGLGVGRINGAKGIAQSGVKVISITDRTPIKEKGPRPKKLRRV